MALKIVSLKLLGPSLHFQICTSNIPGFGYVLPERNVPVCFLYRQEFHSRKYNYMWPITLKGTLWELRKVSTLIRLHSPRSLTTVETFRSWQIFCVSSDNSTKVNCQFEIIEAYRPVLDSFSVLSFLSRSSDKVPFCVTGHIYNQTIGPQFFVPFFFALFTFLSE